MIRRLMMWVGYSPVHLKEVILWPKEDGDWTLRIITRTRWWATQEDVQVVRVNALLMAKDHLRTLGQEVTIEW